jgi:hypothetical protein
MGALRGFHRADAALKSVDAAESEDDSLFRVARMGRPHAALFEDPEHFLCAHRRAGLDVTPLAKMSLCRGRFSHQQPFFPGLPLPDLPPGIGFFEGFMVCLLSRDRRDIRRELASSLALAAVVGLRRVVTEAEQALQPTPEFAHCEPFQEVC